MFFKAKPRIINKTNKKSENVTKAHLFRYFILNTISKNLSHKVRFNASAANASCFKKYSIRKHQRKTIFCNYF